MRGMPRTCATTARCNCQRGRWSRRPPRSEGLPVRPPPRRAFAFYWATGIADDVPALTYYLVLSLAPVALGLAALEALLLSNTQAAINVADGLNRFLPDAAHADIRHLVLGTRDNSPVLLAIALGTMLWTTSGAIGVIERCESRILDCARHSVVAGPLPRCWGGQ